MSDLLHLEHIWDRLLSRDPQLIRNTFLELDPESQATVLAHLQEMAFGEGWHEEQVTSARTALKAIRE